MQSYILTYFRCGKREPLLALGSHQEGGEDFMSASVVPHRGVHAEDIFPMHAFGQGGLGSSFFFFSITYFSNSFEIGRSGECIAPVPMVHFGL